MKNKIPEISFADSLAGLYQREDELKRMIYREDDHKKYEPMLAELKEVKAKIAAWGSDSQIYRIM